MTYSAARILLDLINVNIALISATGEMRGQLLERKTNLEKEFLSYAKPE